MGTGLNAVSMTNWESENGTVRNYLKVFDLYRNTAVSRMRNEKYAI